MTMESLPQARVSSEQQLARSHLHARTSMLLVKSSVDCMEAPRLASSMFATSKTQRCQLGFLSNGSCRHISLHHAPHLTCHYVTLETQCVIWLF